MPNRDPKRLGPTGVAKPAPGLEERALDHLRTIVATSGIENRNNIDGFIDFVDQSARGYRAWEQIQDQNLPGVVREELDRLNNTAFRLLDGVNRLGGTSRHYLYSMQAGRSFDQFHEALQSVITQINRAFVMADEERRSGGRPIAFARRSFAAMIAHAMRTRLGEEPTITRGGLFEQVLTTSLEAIENREVNSVRDLMRTALGSNVVEHDSGVIEIDPEVE